MADDDELGEFPCGWREWHEREWDALSTAMHELDFHGRKHSGKCPECPVRFENISYTIVHLLDRHRWTRDQIAEWLNREPAA